MFIYVHSYALGLKTEICCIIYLYLKIAKYCLHVVYIFKGSQLRLVCCISFDEIVLI